MIGTPAGRGGPRGGRGATRTGTAVVASAPGDRPDVTERVTDVERVPRDGTFLFTVRDVDAGEDREAILVRIDGGGDGVSGDGSRATGDDGTGGSTSSVGGATGASADGATEASADGPAEVCADGATGASADGEPRVRGWLNYCRHLTHVRLDEGRGATMRGDEIVCTNHGAMFEADSGCARSARARGRPSSASR